MNEKEMTMVDEKAPITTTDAGIPAASDEHSQRASGIPGALQLQG
jgi:hypothetical protein